ncbi:MAG: hypothetical protein K2M27_04565, partial [Muribaculaceae bacterium]|nr:hypothetical protein [Muribaculaceae bacterium]
MRAIEILCHADGFPVIERLVRRIVEKRAAQEAHKNAGKHDRETNRYRHSIQRAVSFNLYNKRYAEYDA